MTEVHVCGELIGESADLPSAHRIGLAGERERTHAWLADAAGDQVAVDDSTDLIGALRRLVHPLRKAGDHFQRHPEQLEETGDVRLGEPGGLRGRCRVRRDLARLRQCFRQAGGIRADIFVVERPGVGEMRQQAAEQSGIHAGRNGQKHIGIFHGCRAARVDHHDLRTSRSPVGDHALVQYRMTPGGIRADQDDEIGEIEILVAAGDGVATEGAAVAGDRRGHAQTRIGVDVGRADEAFHQFVGYVIVLCQQLT